MCNYKTSSFSLVENEYTEYLYHPYWTSGGTHLSLSELKEWYSKYEIRPEFILKEDKVLLTIKWHNTILVRYEHGKEKEFPTFSKALEFFEGVKGVYDFHFSKEGVENRNAWYIYNCCCCECTKQQ